MRPGTRSLGRGFIQPAVELVLKPIGRREKGEAPGRPRNRDRPEPTSLIGRGFFRACYQAGHVFEDGGEHESKGVPDHWHLYRVGKWVTVHR